MELAAPARSGSMWTEADYELALERVRAGASVDQLAEALQRKPEAVANKLRRLLPLEQRKCPPDRTVPALAMATADPNYDWRQVVLQTPPEPPVNRIVCSGLSGLDTADLIRITYALATTPTVNGDDILSRALEEVGARCLDYKLIQTRATDLIQQNSPVTMCHALECARDWLDALREDRAIRFDDEAMHQRRVRW